MAEETNETATPATPPAPAPALAPATPAPAPAAPVRPAWLGGSAGGSGHYNVWEWTWKTAEGYSETWRTRGPETEAEAKKVIVQILGAMTQNAIHSGAKDPGLVCTALKPIGRDDSPFDAHQPAGTRPADIFQFGNPAPQTAEEAAAYGQQQP